MGDVNITLASAGKFFVGRLGVLEYAVGTLASGSTCLCTLPDNYSLVNVIGKSSAGTVFAANHGPTTLGGFTCVETAQTLDTVTAGRTAGSILITSYTTYFNAGSKIIATVIM